MTRLLGRAAWRFYLRHPWQLALAVVGISLGVGVYVGVSLANDSAARAFDLAAERVRGTLTHRLLAIDGGIEERLYRDIVVTRAADLAAPIVEGRVSLRSDPGRVLSILGIDALQSDLGPRSRARALGGQSSGLRMLTDPGAVLVPSTLAAELGLGADAELAVLVGEREVTLRVAGLLGDAPFDPETEPALVADIATAQEVLGELGRLDRIDLRLTEEQAERLPARMPTGVTLLPVETERSSFRQLTAAFRTNLTALGLLALVVGAFLIYGTMSFAVLQRSATLGVLRSLGVTGTELVRGVLLEAATIAVVATALGLAIGQALAHGLVGLVLQTIDDLSFGRTLRAVAPSPWIYVQGALLGVAATLVAAAKPALDAARTSPVASLARAALERRTKAGVVRAAGLAAALLLVAALLLWLGPTTLLAGFAALFLVLSAGALLTPLATLGLMAGIDRAVGARMTLPLRLAVRGVSAALSRTGVATAALAVAVATVSGIGLMISTFRLSLADWLDTTLTADLYITSNDRSALRPLVDAGALTAAPGIAAVTLTRVRALPTRAHGTLTVRATEPSDGDYGLSLVAGGQEALEELAAGRGLVVSERLLLARALAVGDTLELPTPGGAVRLPIVGAFQDFNTSEPALVIALHRYRELWHDPEITTIGLDVAEGIELEAVASAIESRVAAENGIRVRSTAGIREISLAVFDRTFKVTEVLRLLAGIVAFLGVLSALLALELERSRELAVLRTLGFTPRGLAGTLLAQTALLGLAAGLAATPLGTALAALLVHVINRRAFGWSMEFVLAPQALLAGLALAIGAAGLAGLYPAWRASRIELGAALREE